MITVREASPADNREGLGLRTDPGAGVLARQFVGFRRSGDEYVRSFYRAFLSREPCASELDAGVAFAFLAATLARLRTR